VLRGENVVERAGVVRRKEGDELTLGSQRKRYAHDHLEATVTAVLEALERGQGDARLCGEIDLPKPKGQATFFGFTADRRAKLGWGQHQIRA